MIRYKSEEQKLQFKSLCTLIDFKYEYPGYDGKIRYGLYSALPTHCLHALSSIAIPLTINSRRTMLLRNITRKSQRKVLKMIFSGNMTTKSCQWL